MTDQLAGRLNVSFQSSETLSVSTIGCKSLHNLNTYVVHFTVATKQDTSLLLHANVVPKITGPDQRRPLLQDDLEFLHSIEPGQLAESVWRLESHRKWISLWGVIIFGRYLKGRG